MCFTHRLCTKTRDAFESRRDLVETEDLYALGYEVARANREDAGISDHQLSETIWMEAMKVSALRKAGLAAGKAAHAAA